MSSLTDTVMLSKNFAIHEFACSHCGKCEVHPELIGIVQEIRDRLGNPLFISSGYRCPEHPVEVMKERGPGEHAHGLAVDIICHGRTALFIMGMGLQLGVTRWGLHQKGRASGRYIHLGIGDKHSDKFPPGALWTY